MDEKLLPCPFCGSSPAFEDQSADCGMPTFLIVCAKEDCVAWADENAEALRKRWNKRSLPRAESEVVEAAMAYWEAVNDGTRVFERVPLWKACAKKIAALRKHEGKAGEKP